MGIRDAIEAKRGLAHFSNANAQRCNVLGAQVRMMTERHFKLIDRFGREAVIEDLMKALERVMKSLQARDAFIHRETGFRRFLDGADAGERGEISIGLIIVHLSGIRSLAPDAVVWSNFF